EIEPEPEPPAQPETAPAAGAVTTFPEESGGAIIYSGPVNEDGSINYTALADMNAADINTVISASPMEWARPTGSSKVYSDITENIGITVQTDTAGRILRVDVWNHAEVAGVKAGMTKAEIVAVLGQPVATGTEPIGDARMISVSQSNRFNGRLTNLSADSEVILETYQYDKGTLRMVFVSGSEACYLLEVLP
ncbi:MAG: hypothetical protein Q4B48_01420, partial [Syntrophomonadaceae bacterium]|nr:hypothetical protein [Syntrophomonadaceae bacterium]